MLLYILWILITSNEKFSNYINKNFVLNNEHNGRKIVRKQIKFDIFIVCFDPIRQTIDSKITDSVIQANKKLFVLIRT